MLSCGYCGHGNKISYGTQLDFTCMSCKKLNFICADLTPLPITSINEELIIDAIEMNDTGNASQAQLKRKAREYLKGLSVRLNGASV